jgi:hypothetical protein
MQMPEQRKPDFIAMQSVRSDIRKHRSMFRQTLGLLDPAYKPVRN